MAAKKDNEKETADLNFVRSSFVTFGIRQANSGVNPPSNNACLVIALLTMMAHYVKVG